MRWRDLPAAIAASGRNYVCGRESRTVTLRLISAVWAGICQGNALPAVLAIGLLWIPAIGAGRSHLTRLGAEALGWGSLRAAKLETPFFLTLVFWEGAGVIALCVGGYLTAWAAPRDGSRPPP